MRILFVCTGNTCRSPLAEGIFRLLAEQHELQVEVKSAGVGAIDGLPISDNSRQILHNKGLTSTESMSSSMLTESLVDWADLVLTMTTDHKRIIQHHFPQAMDRTFTLKEYSGREQHNIADPYGGDLEEYEECAAEIEDELQALIDKMKQEEQGS